MLNNPSVYLLLALLSFVFSGIYPTVLALNLLHAVHVSLRPELIKSGLWLALPVRYSSVYISVVSALSASYIHFQHDLKQVTGFSPLTSSLTSSQEILRERQEARND